MSESTLDPPPASRPAPPGDMSRHPQSGPLLQLTAGEAPAVVRLVIAQGAGARVHQIYIERGDQEVRLLADLPRDSTETPIPTSTAWGSFPMAPWAGRIRNGRFAAIGLSDGDPQQNVRLELNHVDGNDGAGGGIIEPPITAPEGDLDDATRYRHAIHGTVFQRPWTIDARDATSCDLHCELTGALGWPFAGIARQRIEVAPDHATMMLSIEASLGTAPFPGSIGWHPWFVKPDALDFSPLAMYRRDAFGIPTGELVAPPPGPWDDCFVNRRPIRLRYDRPVAPVVTVTSDCDHWVVYDRPEHATCVEPQSGPPDAPSVRPFLVAPDHPLSRTMTISW